MDTPQVDLDNIVKDTFYDQLQNTVKKVGADETLLICGDLNGHIVNLQMARKVYTGGMTMAEATRKVNIFSNLLIILLLVTRISSRKTTI